MKIIKKTLFEIKKIKQKKNRETYLNNIENIITEESIVLFGTPEYCNLGDHLIAASEITFLHDYFPNFSIIEITREMYETSKLKIQKLLLRNTIKAVFITGGGFLGSLWEQMDEDVLEVLSVCKSKIAIILPQTFYYERDSDERLLRDKITYNSIQKLVVFTRDRSSHNYVINTGLADLEHVYLKPDMALYMCTKHFSSNNFREGVALCLRKDKENTLSDYEQKKIEKFVSSLNFGSIVQIETVDKYKSFLPMIRDKEIEKFIEVIESKRLVITNRLHCMVFCFLSKTPCIAIDNISHKITGVYEWIKDCEYIECLEEFNLDSFQCACNRIMKTKIYDDYDYSILKSEFETMGKEIQEVLQ